MASLSPRTAVLLAVVALPLGAAAASYALTEDPAPRVPAEVRIGGAGGGATPTGEPRTATTRRTAVATRPVVVPPAPPVVGDGAGDDRDDRDGLDDRDEDIGDDGGGDDDD